MIGLGSNRLTVCRRGGMSVTQAGRGGMEWLAGGRIPSWASPYSAQATAALKAQFPTQWPTIRDYGFAHPEIVGYMNAYAPEDAKIAYSLVEGIGTRWLMGDGNSWINTGFKPDANTTYGATLLPKFDTQNNKSIFGARDSGNQPTFLLQAYQKKYRTETFGSWTGYGSLLENVVGNIEFSYQGLWQDGVRIATGNYNPSKAWNINMYIYAHNVNGSAGAADYCFIGGFSEFYCKDTNGNRTKQFYPFKRSNAYGMMEIVSGTFFANQGTGTFTELIESPS